MLVALIWGLIVLSGCAGNDVIINLIDKEDIFMMNEGETYLAPRDGMFIADEYAQEIAQIKVQ